MSAINLPTVSGTIDLVPNIIVRNGSATLPSTTNNGAVFGSSFNLNGTGRLAVTFYYSGWTTGTNQIYTITFNIARGSDPILFPPLPANTGTNSFSIVINLANTHYTFPPIRYYVNTSYVAGTYFGFVRFNTLTNFQNDARDPWSFTIEEYPVANFI